MIFTRDPVARYVVRPLAARFGLGPESARVPARLAMLVAITEIPIALMLRTWQLSIQTAVVGTMTALVSLIFVEISLRRGEAFVALTLPSNLVLRLICWFGVALGVHYAVRLYGLGADSGLDMRFDVLFQVVSAIHCLIRGCSIYLLLCDRPPPPRRRTSLEKAMVGNG